MKIRYDILIRSTVSLGLLAIIIFFSFYLFKYHWSLINSQFPLESREGVMQATTDLILKGKNPYELQYQPQYTNVYGILEPIIALPFVKIFGNNTFVHRVISAVFIWLGLGAIVIMLKKKGVPFLWGILAGVFIYAQSIYPGNLMPCIGPHSLGWFLMLACLFLPEICSYRIGSLVISCLCGVLAFYAKAYFMMGLGLMVVYLFIFKSKKQGLLYGGFALSLFIGSLMGMNVFFEYYFYNSFLNHIQVSSNSYAHLLNQLKYYITSVGGIGGVAVGFLLVLIVRLGIQVRKNDIGVIKEGETFFKKLNFLNLNKPLWEGKGEILWVCFILVFIIVYFKLGRHQGQWMGYFYQLITPFLVALIFVYLSKMRFALLIALPLFVGNINFVVNNLNIFSTFAQREEAFDHQNLQVIQKIISQSNNIYHPSLLTSEIIQQNKPVYESGQSEYFSYAAKDTQFLGFNFRGDKKAGERTQEFLIDIAKQIYNKEFDVLFLTEEDLTSIPPYFTQYYELATVVKLKMRHMYEEREVSVWKPK